MVKSKTRRDAKILLRNPSPRLFSKKFRDSKKVKTNHAKTTLRDLSKMLPRFWDPTKIFQDPRFSRYHSPPLLWCLPKSMPFALFNYSSLSYKMYIVLALSSAVTHLLNKTLILHDFQGLEIEIFLKFHDFPSFPWPVWTLTVYRFNLCWELCHPPALTAGYVQVLLHIIRTPRHFSWSISPILQVQMLAIWYSRKVSIFNNNNNIIFIQGNHSP